MDLSLIVGSRKKFITDPNLAKKYGSGSRQRTDPNSGKEFKNLKKKNIFPYRYRCIPTSTKEKGSTSFHFFQARWLSPPKILIIKKTRRLNLVCVRCYFDSTIFYSRLAKANSVSQVPKNPR